jgi:hypothetical protein
MYNLLCRDLPVNPAARLPQGEAASPSGDNFKRKTLQAGKIVGKARD